MATIINYGNSTEYPINKFYFQLANVKTAVINVLNLKIRNKERAGNF